ncbi:hypothetical protein HY492_00115 [Candidatus Woesearchaeota archaeon]|nr:hypothetical protein [Candidatus Woesearchaeota archaeon]
MNVSTRIFSLLLFLLFLPAVSAIGISPAKVELTFEPNKEYRLSFSTSGAETITTYLKGDLAPYAELQDAAQGTGPRGFDVVLRIPEDISPPGQRILLVGAIENPPEGSTVAARAAIQAPVSLFVPYPGVYLETRFSAPTVNVDEPVNFSVYVINRGRDTTTFTTTIVVIDESTNQTVALLDAAPTTITGSEETYVKLGWDTQGQKPGPYRAELTLSYAGQTLKRSETFRIGTQFIRITDFTRDATVGVINPFEVKVQSEWNTAFKDIFAEVTINGTTFKTPTIDLGPWNNGVLQGYWDATRLSAGTYPVDVVVRYGDTFSTLSGEVLLADRTVIEAPASFGWAGRAVFAVILVLLAFFLIAMRRRKK